MLNKNASAEEPTLEPLEEPEEEVSEAEIVEVRPDVKYKLNKRTIDGKLLSDWDRHFTQNQQELKGEVKRTQQENEQLKKEVEMLKQYIDALNETKPTDSYDYGFDAKKLTSEITDKVVKSVSSQIQQQLQEREERTKRELNLIKKEESWKQQIPGIDLEEDVYGTLSKIEEGDLDGIMEKLLHLSELASKQKRNAAEIKRKEAMEAYHVAPPSSSQSVASFPGTKASGVRNKIKAATERAQKDFNSLERGSR